MIRVFKKDAVLAALTIKPSIGNNQDIIKFIIFQFMVQQPLRLSDSPTHGLTTQSIRYWTEDIMV